MEHIDFNIFCDFLNKFISNFSIKSGLSPSSCWNLIDRFLSEQDFHPTISTFEKFWSSGQLFFNIKKKNKSTKLASLNHYLIVKAIVETSYHGRDLNNKNTYMSLADIASAISSTSTVGVPHKKRAFFLLNVNFFSWYTLRFNRRFIFYPLFFSVYCDLWNVQ